jgi:predicted TIM-barrel fold metal-dependent hydrolase
MTPQDRALRVRQMGARHDWWALRREPALEPELEVVDAHFHLWAAREFPDPAAPGAMLQTSRYLRDDFLADARGAGHRVAQAVYVECGSGYYTDGPEHLRCVGETAWAAQQAAQSRGADGHETIAAIVAHADLRHADLETLLDAHAAAGQGRLRSLRQSAARLENPADRLLAGAAPAGLYADPALRRGLAKVAERGLVFDAFLFHFQLDELADLARAVPAATIVLNHLGAPVGYSGGAAESDPVFAAWSRSIDRLADLPNLVVKLGGLASIVTQYDAHTRPRPPSSQDFVAERGAYFHHAIRRFGPERCLFESNFPVDSVAIGYGSLWNAFKTIAAAHGAAAARQMLAGTARRVYRLGAGAAGPQS